MRIEQSPDAWHAGKAAQQHKTTGRVPIDAGIPPLGMDHLMLTPAAARELETILTATKDS
jgi:hypothetical protein